MQPVTAVHFVESLYENLVDSIVKGERPNRTAFLQAQSGMPDKGEDSGDDEDAEPECQPMSELDELLGVVADTISSLFKISMLIRKASPRDRFQKAAAADREPFDDSYDVAHVGHKFPKLECTKMQHLQERFGKAITRRRQFLRYAREHHEKLSHNPTAEALHLIFPENEAERTKGKKLETGKPVQDSQTADIIQEATLDILSSIPRTIASTLAPSNLELIQEDSEDNQSQTSYATSVAEDSEESVLRVLPLTDVAKGKSPFECPYCWNILSIRSERSWR
jgi:hypothetical protein